MDVYADHFVHALGGCKHHVEESADAGRTISEASELMDAGFRWHHVCDESTTSYDLARAATYQLADAGVLEDIDAIVYATALPCSGNVGAPDDWERTRDVKFLMDFPASRLQADFGLDDAVVIGLNQQACTSMIGSLRLSRALLVSEPDWTSVLCLTSDRFPAGALYEQVYNLISDGAAACVVTRAPARFRLVAVHQITNGALCQANDDETVGMYFNYTHRLITDTLARTGLTIDDIDWVVPQNTLDKAWQILARVLGVDRDRIWYPSMPDIGHVISADNIINLEALVTSGQLEPGQLMLLPMAGFGLNWQCAVLEATEMVDR
jgi:3-oxoacyl-[acyl-carrier-protein] synthase III